MNTYDIRQCNGHTMQILHYFFFVRIMQAHRCACLNTKRTSEHSKHPNPTLFLYIHFEFIVKEAKKKPNNHSNKTSQMGKFNVDAMYYFFTTFFFRFVSRHCAQFHALFSIRKKDVKIACSFDDIVHCLILFYPYLFIQQRHKIIIRYRIFSLLLK